MAVRFLSYITMKFSVSGLLDQLENPLTVAQIRKKLSLTTQQDQGRLTIALDALTRLGLVHAVHGKLQAQPLGDDLIKARLRSSSKGFCFAVREGDGDDIYIRDHQLNHAWNGDRVLVRITREGGRRRSPEGVIQCVLERANRTVLAIPERTEQGAVAQPLNDRLLGTIQLAETDNHHDLGDIRNRVVEVVIDRFPVAQRPAVGHVIHSVSTEGGVTQDQKLLLAKHNLTGFTAYIRATPTELRGNDREDLSALPTFLLDGYSDLFGAPQLPALSIETAGQNRRLWVHAPALAERFTADSRIERMVQKHGAAICMGRQWLPLLPTKLAKAAAFEVNQLQEAVSVCLDLNAAGQLLNYRFRCSRIRPDGLLTAGCLTSVLSGPSSKPAALPAPLKPLLPHIGSLLQLLVAVRRQRLAAGSLDLDLRHPALKELGDLRAVTPDEKLQGWFPLAKPSEPMALVREAAVLANRAFGWHCAALGLPAIYLHNEPIEANDLNEVVKTAVGLEVSLELGTDGNGPAPAELAARLQQAERGRALQQQLCAVVKPCTFSTEPGPNILAGETGAYAPWCCAAFHYADLYNQQLLVASIRSGAAGTRGSSDSPALEPTIRRSFEAMLQNKLCQRLSERTRFAAAVETDWIALCLARRVQPKVGKVVKGVISGVQSYGLFVELLPTHVEGLAHVSSLRDDWYEFRSRQHRLLGRKTHRCFKLGDRVDVTVKKVDVLRHQIDLEVVVAAQATRATAKVAGGNGQTAENLQGSLSTP